MNLLVSSAPENEGNMCFGDSLDAKKTKIITIGGGFKDFFIFIPIWGR